jgi:hypothetical protein
MGNDVFVRAGIGSIARADRNAPVQGHSIANGASLTRAISGAENSSSIARVAPELYDGAWFKSATMLREPRCPQISTKIFGKTC